MAEQGALERFPTGVPGLDEVLRGGLLRGGVYLVAGQGGTGKTVLGNQICFSHVARGGRALFVTLLAETNARMLGHLRGLRFFDERPLGDALYYINGFSVLEEAGLEGLLVLLRRTQREREATLLVVDGLSTAEAATGPLPFKKFLSQLQGTASTTGATALLLTEHTDRAHPAWAMVDGLLELEDRSVGSGAERWVTVRKLRGSDHLRGAHAFAITAEGVHVYPRLEARRAPPPPRTRPRARRRSTGLAELDRMLGGGLVEDTTTMVLGSPGSGKTLLGLHFLAAGAAAGERGLHFGFYEVQQRLVRQAAGVGLDLAGPLARGLVRVVHRRPLELLLDEVAEHLLQEVRRFGARRLLLDGLGGLVQGTSQSDERLGRVCTVLSDELHALGVTALITAESFDVVGGAVRLPMPGVSAIVENALFLRAVEVGSRLRRALSVIKMRESAFDPRIRELFITGEGFRLGGPFLHAEGILSGHAHLLPADVPDEQEHEDEGEHGHAHHHAARGADGDDSHR